MAVKMIVGAADGVVMGAVNVTVAEADCVGVGLRVSVEGLAETPEGRPETVTETEPLKELSEEAVIVMALLVVPAVKESEPGEAVREKSGVGLGVEWPPQEKRNVVRTNETASRTKGATGRKRIPRTPLEKLSSIDSAGCQPDVIVAAEIEKLRMSGLFDLTDNTCPASIRNYVGGASLENPRIG